MFLFLVLLVVMLVMVVVLFWLFGIPVHRLSSFVLLRKRNVLALQGIIDVDKEGEDVPVLLKANSPFLNQIESLVSDLIELFRILLTCWGMLRMLSRETKMFMNSLEPIYVWNCKLHSSIALSRSSKESMITFGSLVFILFLICDAASLGLQKEVKRRVKKYTLGLELISETTWLFKLGLGLWSYVSVAWSIRFPILEDVLILFEYYL